MKRMIAVAGLITALWLSLSPTLSAQASATIQTVAVVTTHAIGTFDVKVTPVATDTAGEGSPLGRFSLEKQWHGDVEGTSHGEMLTAGSSVKNSAGYVAVERFTGTVNGRRGTFALQHTGTMTRGVGQLTITIVPDSGTGELAGISGSLGITIADGKHSYDLEYSIAGAP